MAQAKDAGGLEGLSLETAVPGLVAPTPAEEFVRKAIERADEEAQSSVREDAAAATEREEEARQLDKWPADATGDLIRKAVARQSFRPRRVGLKLTQRQDLVTYMLQRRKKSYPWDGGASRLFLPMNWLTAGTNSSHLSRLQFTLEKWQEQGYYHCENVASYSGYLTEKGRSELAISLGIEPVPFEEQVWGILA